MSSSRPASSGTPSDCPKPAGLWTAPVGSDRWVRQPVALPKQGAALTAAGSTAYVYMIDASAGDRQVFQATTDGGSHWAARPSPCQASAGERLLVHAASATDAALLCSANFQAGLYSKRVFYSTDTARTSDRRGDAPNVDVPLGFAVSGKVLAVAGSGGSSVVQRSPDQGRTWTTPYTADPAPMSDLQLRGSTGTVVRGSADYPGGPGQLLISHDTGRHWTVAAVLLPAQ